MQRPLLFRFVPERFYGLLLRLCTCVSSHLYKRPLASAILQETVGNEALRMHHFLQGSGWGWLGWSKEYNKLMYSSTPNQDPLHLQV